MKIGSSKASIDHLDRYLAKKEYDKALEAIKKELWKNPSQLNLRLRQAEILDLQGKRHKAIFIYRDIAEAQARDGFYARAIAVYKKILRLDPEQNVRAHRLIEIGIAPAEFEPVFILEFVRRDARHGIEIPAIDDDAGMARVPADIERLAPRRGFRSMRAALRRARTA